MVNEEAAFDEDETAFDGMDEPPREYPVGYAVTPEASRWRKGQSGNPRGRPKKNRSRQFLLKKVALRVHDVVEGGRHRKRTTLEVILLKLKAKAIEGNKRASALCEWARGIADEADNDEPVQRAVLIVGERLTQDEWMAKYGHLGNAET